MARGWWHTIIFDDSLHQLWHATALNANIDYQHGTARGSTGPSSCSFSMRLQLQPKGRVALQTDPPLHISPQLFSLQLWARGRIGRSTCTLHAPSGGLCSGSAVCLGMCAAVHPLCAFGAVDAKGWRKLVIPLSSFECGHGLGQIVFHAATRQRRAVELLLDDVVLVSAAPPPRVRVASLPPPRQPSARSPTSRDGWCEYLHSEFGRRATRQVPACRVVTGDHLAGRWVQNCAPALIKRPDRYAYHRSLPRSNGTWDYRMCFKMGYTERERARSYLSFSWQPERCAMPMIDAAAFVAWLGRRVMLLWGDSLSGQLFFSLVQLLGGEVRDITDYSHWEAGEAKREGSCTYSGLAAEGGPLTVATLRGGGRLVKILGHAEMPSQARDLHHAWWRPAWEAADIIVFSVGHHFRTIDGSFRTYERMVRDSLTNFANYSKFTAQLIFRTSNVGHLGCEDALAPFSSRERAWAELGGWHWRPPTGGRTPAYFGASREGVTDKFDWRAPPLHEFAWLKYARRILSLSKRFSVLNVSHLDLRPDGHVGSAMKLHANPIKAAAGPDCLHYCFPGPSDAWAHSLYAMLLANKRFALHRNRA